MLKTPKDRASLASLLQPRPLRKPLARHIVPTGRRATNTECSNSTTKTGTATFYP